MTSVKLNESSPNTFKNDAVDLLNKTDNLDIQRNPKREECPVCLEKKYLEKYFRCSTIPHQVCARCEQHCKCCPMCRAPRIKPISRCVIWNSRVFYDFIKTYTNNTEIAEQQFKQHLSNDCYIYNHSIKISQENNIYYMECLQCKIKNEFRMT
jgi:hypothetical protein